MKKGGDNVKKRLIAENIIRKDNERKLDFASKAINPVVYPNFEIEGTSDSESKKNELSLKGVDPISKNIERDNVVNGHQGERDESPNLVMNVKKGDNIGTGFDSGRQKYFITQIRNYLPLVKDEGVRKKLKIFLKYLQDTSSADELAINGKGHVLRGLFDTQTKFSGYLSYYVLSEGEKPTVKKPPFYDAVIADPLVTYL